MNSASAVWTVLACILAAAGLGFGGAWLIQHWRIRAGRAAGEALQLELGRLRRRLQEVPAAGPGEAHWKAQAERLAVTERALAEERAQWQAEAVRAATRYQECLRERDALSTALEQAQGEQLRALASLREALEAQHAQALAAQQAAHAQALDTQRADHAAALDARQAEYAEGLDAQRGEHADTLESLRTAHAAALAELAVRHAAGQADSAAAAAREEPAERRTDLLPPTVGGTATETLLAEADHSVQAEAAQAAEAAANRAAEAAAAQAAEAAAAEAAAAAAAAEGALQEARDQLEAQQRELVVLRSQLGASSERILDLEQSLNRLQLEAMAQARREAELREAGLRAQEAAAEQAQAQATVSTETAALPIALAGSATDAEARERVDRQRLQELEEANARARRLAGEHRAEVAGLKNRIRDLEDKLADLWKQGPGREGN